MRSGKILASMAIATLALSGCTSGSDDGASSAEESKENQLDPADFAGLVAVAEEEQTLEFVAPESGGEANLSFEFDGAGEIGWTTHQDRQVDRAAFSADWQYVAWSKGETQAANGQTHVEVAQLNPDSGAYEVVSNISGLGEESYSDEAVNYKNPRFAPDGETLWVESSREGEEGETETTLESVEYEDAGEDPEANASDLSFTADYVASGTPPSYEHWSFSGDEGDEPVLTLPDDAKTVEDGEFSADYWVDDDGQITRADFVGNDGDCEQLTQLEDGEFLLRDCGEAAITQVTIDPDAETVELTEVVANGKDTIDRAYLSPDQSSALLVAHGDRSNWYQVNLDDSGGEPEALEQAPDFDNGAVVVAWE